jgi:serine/threonine-protein kinase RsbT
MIFDVENDFDVLFVRNAAKHLASEMGFSAEDRTRIDLAVSELAHNLIRHAGHGKLMINQWEYQGQTAFEAISVDSGPGIEDLEKVLQWGYSTKNTLGTGLPSVKEVMDDFCIDSRTGIGTRVIVRKWLG